MPLQVGAAQIDITPPLGCHLDGNLTDRVALNLHDPLYAKAIVWEQDGRRVGVVVCDLIIVTREMADEVKQRVQAAVGLPPEALLVTATHTHYGPAVYGALLTRREESYVAWAPPRIADAVIQAVRSLQPAEVGWAVGSCASEVFNRRFRMRDGSVQTNAGVGNPKIVGANGPADPTFSLLVARTPEGRPLAALGNLALHYVGSANDDVSADYFGYFAAGLQRCAGAPFVAALTNGCFGDLNNIDVRRPRRAPHPYHHTRRVGEVVAGEAWKLWNTLWEEDYHDDLPLAWALEQVPLTPRRPTAAQLSAARDYLATARPAADSWAYAYALDHLKMVDQPTQLSLPLQVLRIGEVALAGLPGEVFAEVGLALKAASPYPVTMPIGLANDTVGYVAPDEQLAVGGYECTLCRHVVAPPGTVQTWLATHGRLLRQTWGC
ncbi:MAG: hypothetical protein IT204_11645 [Fimbriimonadaceae bacterium]|nr:hypothetical protein [Fimbriimonadaceae bacterium]